jgi:hypothetical protein
MINSPLFSVDDYDHEGDKNASGVFLHFGDVRVHVAESVEDFDTLIERLQSMSKEIKENY